MRIRRTVIACAAAVVTAAFVAGCGSASAGKDPAKDTAKEVETDAVQKRLDEFVKDGAIVGGEVTIRDGDDSAQALAGVGNRETDAKYPSDAHVRVASVTKAFTSAMVLQLVSEDEVDLDASIEEYLPGLLHGDGIDAGKITVRHLLRHQSGLPEIGDATQPQDPEVTFTPQQLIDMALENPVQAEPGEKMIYTNTNYVVAGMLIEKLTGDDYGDALKERITKPLRLKDTYLPEPGDTGLAKPHPQGYFVADGEPKDVTEADASGTWASGGIVSSGADLNAYFTALTEGEVVDKAQLKQMRDTVPMTGVPGVEYGLGLMRLPTECELKLWGQAGDVPGFQAMTATTADGKKSATIAINQSPSEKFGPEQLLGLLSTALC
ncbi:serine hydrolase domain-containing protein [Stackebrandtia nassauensis]|uniref:Beta-lactamase n=1 Tax=Stackebrandtia nassauensis (strain DSM 44728 / CIP 108903 / NRRL B-16338 / NBRC 102104 / LLR-40K-21) TaxID=446470 RepID=D3Q156_STANL|nr:serine hydrolase domain-containing protein [Stackebrandtia nassauensis]ADD43806.1 beta-lactamase [Stackebrandtia nassauensis DSM 44728]